MFFLPPLNLPLREQNTSLPPLLLCPLQRQHFHHLSVTSSRVQTSQPRGRHSLHCSHSLTPHQANIATNTQHCLKICQCLSSHCHCLRESPSHHSPGLPCFPPPPRFPTSVTGTRVSSPRAKLGRSLFKNLS